MQSDLIPDVSVHRLPEPRRLPKDPDGLSVVDLRKSFVAPNGSRLEVLRGLSLEISSGESVAIMGASGSGKSTLLQLLGGLDEPDHGAISLGDEDVVSETKRAATFRQRHVGFVFQFHYLISDLSAVENVALPLMIRRLPKSAALSRAKKLLTEFGLVERADHPVAHLSGGEQQRIAVARALVTEPTMILADEPTGNLDTAISLEIAKTLVNYSTAHSRIAVVATHNPALAHLCDRVLVLEDGRLRAA